jgi:hypothetical protein
VTRTGLTLLLLAFIPSGVLPQAPTLDELLARAGAYVTGLCSEFPLLVAKEDYQQVLQPYGSNRTDLMRQGAMLGQMGLPKNRRTKGEYALVGLVEAAAWMAYRDIREIDGKAVTAQEDRLASVLSHSETPEAEAGALANLAVAQNLGVTLRGVTVSTFGLVVVMPMHRAGFEFANKGEKRVGNEPVRVVAFNETRRPSLLQAADGQSKPARGELWIEAATGRILRTHVVFDSLDAYPDMKMHPERYDDFPRATIDVVFAPDPVLKAYLPVSMQEIYTRKDEVVTCKSAFTGYRKLERHPEVP